MASVIGSKATKLSTLPFIVTPVGADSSGSSTLLIPETLSANLKSVDTVNASFISTAPFVAIIWATMFK